MQVNLIYNLPEEKDEYLMAMNGASAHAVIIELDNWLRNLSKYQNIKKVNVIEVRAKLNELLKEQDLSI